MFPISWVSYTDLFFSYFLPFLSQPAINSENLNNLTIVQTFLFLYTLYGRRQAEKCFQTCAKRADSDHPAHAQSLIRAFVLHWYILLYPMILLADCEGADQTAQSHSLIWAFAVRACPDGTFLLKTVICTSGCLNNNPKCLDILTIHVPYVS